MPDTVVCLWFDRQAEEAAAHYTSIFPNSTIGDVTHYLADTPSGPADGSVMTVEFTLDGRPFIALNGGPMFEFNEAMSVQVRCADQAEIDHYWDRLSEGGEPGQCGWLKDRFGVSWQVTPRSWLDVATGDPAKAARAMEAVLKMTKIDLAEIERAIAG